MAKPPSAARSDLPGAWAAEGSASHGGDPAPPVPLLRSGSVARLLGMPVATLRVWERRYALTRTAWSPGGQRLYAPDDLQRLALMKRLNEQGHAIGQLAPLDLAQLQGLAQGLADVLARATGSVPPAATVSADRGDGSGPAQHPRRPWRLGIVGVSIADRLRRPAVLQRLAAALGRPVVLVGPFDSLQAARQARSAGDATSPEARSDLEAPDAWLIHQPQLMPDTLADLPPGPGTDAVAVLYRFGSEAACESLAARGLALLREPQPEVALVQWLGLWGAARIRSSARLAAVDERGPARGLPASPDPTTAAGEWDVHDDHDDHADRLAAVAPIPPRRWDDATLTDLATRASAVACECPRHVAELLLQLAQFEAYSAECRHRSPADAELHAALARTAGRARVGFEHALQRVALHEGWPWPPG